MQHPTPLSSRRAIALRHTLCAAWLGAGLFCAGAALAQNAAAPQGDAQARYRQEMALCNSGKSPQDAATCRREATNALAESRRGGLTTAGADQANNNAMQRCSALPENQRGDCMARMKEGNTQGSVSGGGVLREHITVVPVPSK